MRRNNAYDFFLLQVVSCSLQHSAAVRHLARRTTRDDMASSSYGARDWQKTSEPRVDFDRRVGKWRLRMNYTASSKKTTIIVRSSYVSTREEVEAMLPWWRLGWEQGNKGKKVNPPTQVNLSTPPDQQQSSDSPPTAEAMATTLPQGEFHSVPCVCFRSILCSIFIAPRAVCGCSTSSLLSREACTGKMSACSFASVRYWGSPHTFYVAAALLFLNLCENGIGRTAVCVIHLRQCKHGT